MAAHVQRRSVDYPEFGAWETIEICTTEAYAAIRCATLEARDEHTRDVQYRVYDPETAGWNNNAKSNTDRLLAYQRRPTTIEALRERLTEQLQRSYASEPDWDEPVPPTTRTGETPAPQGCNEVACRHYGRCDGTPGYDCFELRSAAGDEFNELDALNTIEMLRTVAMVRAEA
jgi:hypothetical protein